MFPGKNSMNLSHEAVSNMLLPALQQLHMDIRITDISMTYSGAVVSFTTDPLPLEKALIGVAKVIPKVEQSIDPPKAQSCSETEDDLPF